METNNKLREAMIEILEYIETFHKYITPGKGKKLTALFAVADTIRNKARAALAEPIKNCEVGTSDEQALRFVDFCGKHHTAQGRWICHECPCKGNMSEIPHCLTKWGQMPYESGTGESDEQK